MLNLREQGIDLIFNIPLEKKIKFKKDEMKVTHLVWNKNILHT